MSVVLENISYTYMKKTPYERKALDKVSLTIEQGEFIAIIGHSGSGKTTLVQQISGLLNPDEGRVLVDGIDLSGKTKEVVEARRKIGIVFQYPEHQLFAETVYEDIAFGPRNMGLSEDVVKERVEEALLFVQLDYNEFSKKSPFELSGGQMRRVAIAGIIAMKPDYLVLDEPTAGLDPLARNAFYEEVRFLYDQSKTAIILVTHSMEEAIELSNRLLVMSGGQIIMDGRPEDIFKKDDLKLKNAGVDIPEIISLGNELRKAGFNINDRSFSSQMLSNEILRNLKKEGK